MTVVTCEQSSVPRFLDDVFEAECAVTGEPLALASATQVLSVGSLWVNVALCDRTATARFLTSLEKSQVRAVTHSFYVQ